MALNVQTLKDQLKRIDSCQHANENSIEQDLVGVQMAIDVLLQAQVLDDALFSSDLFVQPPNKYYLLYELPFHAIKYIFEFKQFSNFKNDQTAKCILLSTVELCLKVYQQYPTQMKSLETIKFIIDPDRQYFRFHSQVEQDETRFTSDIELSAEQMIWCQELKEGDQVDALKQDQRTSITDWSRGTINKCTDRHLWIKWQGDEESSVRKVLRYSWDVVKQLSKVSDEDWSWRMNLNVGDVIDCPDDNVWYNSTVIERHELQDGDGLPIIEVKIGFRFYDENGTLVDPKRNEKFFGWSSQYDEDMNVTNTRIQKLGKYAKKFCKYASMSYAEESIKDQSDFIYEEKQVERVYAVPRFNTRSQRRSQVMIDIIQRFGQVGGFKLILEQLDSQNPWCPIDATSYFLMILGNMGEMLTRSFCYEYIILVWEAAQKNLIQSPDSNLRNYSSQKVSDALTGLGVLLKRVFSLKEKTEMIDKLDMTVALKCFNSDFLERKLQGLKAIQEILKKSKEYQMNMQNSDIKFLTTQVMVEWINENKIFEQLYVQNTNSHLIQRSSEFLKFMLDEHLVTIEQIEMVWVSAKKNETEEKLAVYKVLKDVSSSLAKEHLDFLIDRVCEKEAQYLTKDDVELLGDLTRYNYRFREEFCQRFCDFYWALLSNSHVSKVSSVMLDQIIQYYIDQVNSFEMRPHRQAQMTRIAQVLVNNRIVNVALRVLVRFIEKLEVQALSWDNLTRNVALTELESTQKVTEQVIMGLQQVKQLYQSGDIQLSQYLDDVRARMQFIQFCKQHFNDYILVYSNITTTELRLSFQVIDQLWDQLVTQSVCAEERDFIYKWFSALAANGSTLTSIVSQQDLQTFFDTKMTSDTTQLNELTLQGFYCFKAVFGALNNQLGHISQTIKETYSTSYNSFYSNTKSEAATQGKPEIKVLVDPTTLYGFSTLWNIIINAQQLSVGQCANEYLQELYQNLAQDLVLTQPILNYIFSQLTQDDDDKIMRVLMVLEDTIDQSEINGAGNLKSLNALRSSEQVKIPVLNEHTSGTLIPKTIHITIQENATIIELRHAISKSLRAPWDTISLQSTKGEVKFSENGKMVKDLRLKKGETLIANKRTTPDLVEKLLLDSDQNLTADARVVFGEIFDEYSTAEKMSKEQCARFVTGCTGNPCSQEDQQISKTFEQYDKDKDGLLTLNDFVEFYTEAARTKKSTVWQNLHTLNYRNDLLRGDRVPLPIIQSSQIPRGQITKSPEWMQQLFSLLDSPNLQLQEQAWNLLRRLPPSPQYFKKIVNFEGIHSSEDWEGVFSVHSNFRLLYSLHIIEFLMSNHSEGQTSFLALIESDSIEIEHPQLRSQASYLSMKDKWMGEFLSLGGFDHLFQYFNQFQGKSVSSLDINKKEILSFLLNTFSLYLVAACAIKLKGVYRVSQLLAQQGGAISTLHLVRSQEIEEPADFKELILKLQDGLGESIIKMFDLRSFVQVLKSIVDELLSSTRDLEPEDRAIVEYSLITIVIVLLYDQGLAVESVEDEDFLRVLFDGLYTEKSSNIRGLFSRAILLFCHQSQAVNGQKQPTEILLTRLIGNLRSEIYSQEEIVKAKTQSQSTSSEYYELMCSLIDAVCVQEQNNFIEFEEFTLNVVNKLLQHPSSESRQKNTIVDGVLVGLLNLLEKLVSMKPHLRDMLQSHYQSNLVSVVFNECLFAISQPTKEVKCKSAESRSVAYKLLLALAHDHQQSLIALLSSLSDLSKRIPVLNKWNYVPSQDMRSPNGFVGIRNLGCICYMNAMLQQFYMTPTFRYGIMMANDLQDEQIVVRPSDSARIDDNILHQLQSMFAHLELSDRVDYNSHEFCFAFKDFSGEPVNVLIQQDAQEFLNMIFDKLETALKPTPFKYIMDGVYGGKTCTQLVCSKCNNVRNKEEQFYNLSLPIKNLKNLNECFEKYIEGEIISDFNCEACNSKVDVTKRQFLSSLPNVLILHLQRIVFNLDTLMNEKINTKLEFPSDLDLKDYTLNAAKDDIDEDCTKYRLAGVVIHFGEAEFGHYFSYIDIKRHEKELFEAPDQWLEFNDSKIKEFKVKQIEQECFGGASTSDNDDEMWGGWNKAGRENSQNAYILIYEKKQKVPIKLVFDSQVQMEEAQQFYSLPTDRKVEVIDSKIHVMLDYHDLKPFVPDNLNQKVTQDNQQFLLERNLFDPELQKFLLDTLSMVGIQDDINTQLKIDDEDTKQSLIDILSKFSFELLARALDNKQLETFVKRLKILIKVSPQSSYQFLNTFFFSKLQKIVELLLVCPETKTRAMVAQLLSFAFNQVIEVYNINLTNEDEHVDENLFGPDDTQLIIKHKIMKGLKTIFQLLQEQVPKNWIRLESYFAFWVDFMRGGEQQINFMMENQFITYMIDFILEKQSPLKLYEKKHSMGNSYFQLNYENILLIVHQLVQKKTTLSQNDMTLLYNFRFYDKVIKNLTSVDAVSTLCSLVVDFAHNNMFYSEIICGSLLRGMNRADQDEIGTYFSVISSVLKINDQYKNLRIEWLLGVTQMQNHSSSRHYSQKSDLNNFGLYGIQNLDEDFLHFPSPLGWQATLLDYIIQNRSNKSNDNQCLLAIKCLLNLALNDEILFEFIKNIPSCNYQFKYFEDVLTWYTQQYIVDSKRYFYHNFPRDTHSEETKLLMDQYQAKLPQDRPYCDYIIGKSVLVSQNRRYLYGVDSKTHERIIIDEHAPDGKAEWKLMLNNSDIEKICILEDRIYKTYVCDNLPTGASNEALPSLYVKGSQFYTYSVLAKTMPANFIQSKQWNTTTYYEVGEEDTEAKEEQETESLEQTAQPENQRIMNPRFNECVRQISVQSSLYKPIQAVVRISSKNKDACHYVPESSIQSMIQPSSTAFMFTTQKNKSDAEFTELTFQLDFKPIEVEKDSHLYLSPAENQKLDNINN